MRDSGKYECKMELEVWEMKSAGRMVEKHFEVAEFLEREK